MKRKSISWAVILITCAVIIVLTAVANLEQGRQAEDIRQLEQALKRTAVACYAVEGVYPPDVDYMRQRYGLTFDDSRYTVHYELAASNLMPQIHVMVRNHEK